MYNGNPLLFVRYKPLIILKKNMFVILCSFSFDILLIKSLKQLRPPPDQQIPPVCDTLFSSLIIHWKPSTEWASRTRVSTYYFNYRKNSTIQFTSIGNSVCFRTKLYTRIPVKQSKSLLTESSFVKRRLSSPESPVESSGARTSSTLRTALSLSSLWEIWYPTLRVDEYLRYTLHCQLRYIVFHLCIAVCSY